MNFGSILHEYPALVNSAMLVILLIAINEFYYNWYYQFALTPSKVVDLINHQKALILDFRKDLSLGMIKQAKQFDTIDSFLLQQNKGNKKPIIVVSDKNASSIKIVNNLRKLNYTQSYYLIDGMYSWHKDKLPIKRT